MLGAGLPPNSIVPFALAMAYKERGFRPFVRARWRNIAYCVRYGKGVSLAEALSLDIKSMGDLTEALAYCIQQEAKASKPKKR